MSISTLIRNLGNPGVSSATTETLKPSTTPKEVAGRAEFKELLEKELKFSGHAETRIKSRAIEWTPELQHRISSGIDAASSKGSREALILADNLAVIANVQTRTVITAIERNQMKEKVFTNIDTAVLV